jgi:hypothetical protein
MKLAYMTALEAVAFGRGGSTPLRRIFSPSVAKLADAQDRGSCAFGHAGSSPVGGTNFLFDSPFGFRYFAVNGGISREGERAYLPKGVNGLRVSNDSPPATFLPS